MTAEDKAKILSEVAAMLDAPSVEVSLRVGVHRFDGGDGWMHAEPTDGKEITIKINGGAVDYETERVTKEK